MSEARGCGYRVSGGVYLLSERMAGGSPIEDFIVCPPIPLDIAALGISDVGTHLIERNGKTMVFDIIGAKKHYPSPADFVEEARRMGVSRRSSLSSAADYSRLNEDSRLLLIHRRAYISNYLDYTERMTHYERRATACPHHKEEHKLWRPQAKMMIGSDEMCAQLWYHDLLRDLSSLSPDEKMEYARSYFRLNQEEAGTFDEAFPRIGRRKTASVSYIGHATPEGVRPQWEYALFLSLPITKIELVDPEGQYRDREKKARAARLPFEVVNE